MRELYDYLNLNYKVDYVLTARLNQDIIENFFSYIRGMGASNDHPHPLDFKYRLRWFILGKNSAAVFTESTNTEEHGEQCLVAPLESNEHESVRILAEGNCLTEYMLRGLSKNLETVPHIAEEEKLMPHSFIEPQYPEIDLPETEAMNESLQLLEDFEYKEKINQESLKYIAGYVAYKFRNKYNLGSTTTETDLAPRTDDWVYFISRGGLLNPNKDLLHAAEILDSEFNIMHGTSLSKEKNIFKALTDRTISKLGEDFNMPYEVIYCLSRTRTYIRLRDLNRKISFQNCKQKFEKKMSKFTNCKKNLINV